MLLCGGQGVDKMTIVGGAEGMGRGKWEADDTTGGGGGRRKASRQQTTQQEGCHLGGR
jgi:hypothetical protein